MKISELCARSGFNRSTVHNYLRMGLLPAPIKAGLNLHLYGETHLRDLQRIRYLKEVEGMSLSNIKDALHGVEQPIIPKEAFAEAPVDWAAKNPSTNGNVNKGHQIVEKGISLFSEFGYENVKVSDITEALHMGKGTFYLYFKNKQELLLECFKTLRSLIIPLEQRELILQENDFYKKMINRWIGFQKAYPSFPGILNLLRTAATSNNLHVREKAREAYDSIIQPLRDDISEATKDGAVRNVDPEIFAYILWGIAEHMAFRVNLDDDYTMEEHTDIISDLVKRMFLPQGQNTSASKVGKKRSGIVTDRQGVISELINICFGGEDHLKAYIGEAEISIPIERICSIFIAPEKGPPAAEITLIDGSKSNVQLDTGLSISGETSMGDYKVSIKGVLKVEMQGI